MTDDGPQPPIKQLAIAPHQEPATHAWCGPLLLVLLGGVVTLFVLFAYCLIYVPFWVCLGQGTQNVGNIRTVEIRLNPNAFYVSVQSARGSATQSSSKET